MELYVRHFLYYYDYDEDTNLQYGDFISEFNDLLYFKDSERLCLKTSQGSFYAENVSLEDWNLVLIEFNGYRKNFFGMYLDFTKFNLIFTRG